ncbi:MAG: F0F1 ATP synthase subunit A [Holosporales bacterium]|nr:F0F1 ATP synthase subunit A [Holosporales bacterium]
MYNKIETLLHWVVMLTDPMASFEVYNVIPINLFGLDLSITNSAIFMFISVFLILCIFIIGTIDRGLIPNKIQIITEKTLGLIGSIVQTNIKSDISKLFPYMCSLFFFIVFGNVLGLFPFAFSFTSQLVVTFGLAFAVFLTSIVIGFCKKGLGYFKHFCPHGIPSYIIPFFIVIEIMSFFFRPISLGIRLFANIVSGHLIIKVIAGFAILLAGAAVTSPFVIIPIIVNVLLNIFKLAVCLLQAYVFVVLSCIYLSESLDVSTD